MQGDSRIVGVANKILSIVSAERPERTAIKDNGHGFYFSGWLGGLETAGLHLQSKLRQNSHQRLNVFQGWRLGCVPFG